MCGIAGILLAAGAADPRRLGAIGPLATALRHRGPDSSGVWTDAEAGIALGHRRLAIVDLSPAGHQPMLSHSGRFVASYNGEIYNAADLRPGLEAAGHRFAGHSDTEVMLAAFDRAGVLPALPDLGGMFAVAVWDRRDRVLHLVRDRIGKKPLYVAQTPGALVFASELKAIRAFPGFEPRVDRRALALYLRTGWVPDPLCIWDGVFKLPPGTALTVAAEDVATSGAEALLARARPWWSLGEVVEDGQRRPYPGSEAEAEDELDRLLRRAVQDRLVSDVPLGAFLSGGIDSSTVVALMQAQARHRVRTFTIGFDAAGYDEAGDAARIARHLGTDHHTLRVTSAEAQAVVPDLPTIWDEPFADESQIPTYLVARLAREHVTVALSGDGGDECFGGYRRHVTAARLGGVLGLPPALRRGAGGALALAGTAWIPSVAAIAPDRLGSRLALAGRTLSRLGGMIGGAGDAGFYDALVSWSGSPDGAADGAGLRLPGAASAPELPDLAQQIMYRDMASYLPGDVLVKVDRASMAVALEARCPLLDHRVVEFAWRLPPALKIRGGQGKWLLRRVLRRYVPERLFERPKAGFNVPISAWLAGPLRDWAGDLLAGPALATAAGSTPARCGPAGGRMSPAGGTTARRCGRC